MFGKIGNELKFWANLLNILFSIASVFLGIYLGSLFIEESPQNAFPVFLLSSIVIYLLGRWATMLLYAFGELVESTADIRDHLLYENRSGRIPVNRTVPQQAAPTALPQTWTCRYCGEQNGAGHISCKKCNKTKTDQK